MPSRRLGVVASAVLAGALVAQESLSPVPLFLDTRVSPMPLHMANTVALYPAHFDRDGRLDVAVANRKPDTVGPYRYSGSWVLRGIGDGRLRNDAQIDETVNPGADNWRLILAAADLDGDLDIDLPYFHPLTTGLGIGVNDGFGGFTWREDVIAGFHPTAVVAADLDRDGDIDLCDGTRLVLNQGGLVFVEATATHMPPPGFAQQPVLASADFDNDGDLDLLLGNREGQDRLYVNDGTAHFTDVTATLLPVQSDATRGLAVADLDGDGDLDAVRARLGAEPAAYRNDGTGRMSYWALSTSVIHRATAVAVADVDSDGDLDVAVGLEAGGELLLQAGGRFTRAPAAWDPQLAPTTALVFCDLDGDGDQDLLQGSANPAARDASQSLENRTFLNDGQGHFLTVPLSPLDAPFAEAMAAGADLDGDGDLDILDASEGGRLLRNDGFGSFATRELHLPVAGRPLVGDLDGDRDLDVVLVDRAGAFHLLRNPGDGSLWPTYSQWLNLGGAVLEAGALGDLDRDGDLDLVLVTWAGGLPPPPAPPDALWLNAGDGSFHDASQRLNGQPGNATDVALGDLDNDGDLDIVTTGGVLYRNTGTLFVSEPFAIENNYGESHIALAHLDGDGFLDLAAGNACRGLGCAPSNAGGWDVVHFNDGNGRFGPGLVLEFQSSMATSVAVGDVDGDGDHDVLIGHIGVRGVGHDNPAENTLFLNQVNRTFRKASIAEFPLDFDDTLALVLADADSDGDADLIACNRALDTGATRGKVHASAQEHLWAPAFARLGRRFPLLLYGARNGAELWAAAAPARIAVPPFGILGLDPATLVSLQRVGPSSRPVEVAWTIPNDVALSGAALYFQAFLFGPSPGLAHLSNRLAHTVLPH